VRRWKRVEKTLKNHHYGSRPHKLVVWSSLKTGDRTVVPGMNWDHSGSWGFNYSYEVRRADTCDNNIVASGSNACVRHYKFKEWWNHWRGDLILIRCWARNWLLRRRHYTNFSCEWQIQRNPKRRCIQVFWCVTMPVWKSYRGNPLLKIVTMQRTKLTRLALMVYNGRCW